MRKIVQYTLIPCVIITFLLAMGSDPSGWLPCFVGISVTLLLVLLGLLIEERVKRAWQESLAEHVQALRAHKRQQQSQQANHQD